jgi:hypothetical protein
MRTKEQVYRYLMQPSHLFLKQIIQVEETKDYIVVQDLRKAKKFSIPDKVLREFEYYFSILKSQSCKAGTCLLYCKPYRVSVRNQPWSLSWSRAGSRTSLQLNNSVPLSASVPA